jgi:phage terminase large subunit-like protein
VSDDGNLHRYARDVLAGDVVAGELVRLTCERSRRDHAGGAALRGFHFSRAHAEAALAFFRFCRHSKGEWAGREFHLEPWQAFIVWEVFGWLRADGSRRFRVVYEEIARKNGKTSVLAALGLYLMLGDAEPGAEVYSAATKLDQAKIMHADAISMVRSSPVLSKRLTVRHQSISDRKTASRYVPLGSDSKTLDGLNVHAALVDELHQHPSRDLWDVLETGTGARRSPLMWAITTAGDDDQSFCFQEREYGEQVLRGVLQDEARFVFIAALDERDDWRDPRVWVKANPNLGVSVKIEQLAEAIEQAAHSPARESSLLRYRLNRWVRATSRFLSIEAWDRCAGPMMPGEIERACAGRECAAGLDLASVNDIAAFAAVFPPLDPTDIYRVAVRLWIPEEDLEGRAKRSRVPYDQWVRDGWIVATPGNVTDYARIHEEIVAFADVHPIRSLGFDPWNATEIITNLQAELGDDVPVKVPVNYGNFSPPTKRLERLVLGGKLAHGGHPVLRWMASNLEVREHQGAIAPVKPGHKMSHKKIDGMVAVILALSRIDADERDMPSVYEQRGPIVA